MSKEWAKALLALGVTALVAYAALTVDAWDQGARDNPDEIASLVDALFGPYVFAFEVLSILLLGALIGALYLGAKWRRQEAKP
jgi:NADH:ubiquinone oxidoreductase subunit 6 (subunit J)